MVYFSTATNRRSRGATWSIIAPAFIHLVWRMFILTKASRLVDLRIGEYVALLLLPPYSPRVCNYVRCRGAASASEAYKAWRTHFGTSPAASDAAMDHRRNIIPKR